MGDSGIVGRKLNTVDWVGFFVCFAIGSGVADVVGRQVHPVMDFWPAFGTKVAAGARSVSRPWPSDWVSFVGSRKSRIRRSRRRGMVRF